VPLPAADVIVVPGTLNDAVLDDAMLDDAFGERSGA
jgi:hypothetical protein